jgi:hypothetical protein
MIVHGKAKPSFIVSHLGIDDGPDAYKRFDEHADGFTKIALKPSGNGGLPAIDGGTE